MSFARFMSTPVGRGLRVLLGAAVIVWGLAVGGSGGLMLAVVGVVPLLAGLFNVCLLAPVLHAPFSGRRLSH
jgi:Protein of unknown function (DUF2892)